MNTYSFAYPISQTKLSSLRFPRVNVAAVLILVFICVIGFLGFYVFQITNLAESSSLIEGYKNEFNRLSRENKNLEINRAQLNSFENIEALVQNLNFEKIEKTHYIRILENSVVISY